jgi:hypothetical protein
MKFPTLFYAGEARTASISKRCPSFHLSALPLVAALIIPIIARAQTQPVPPLPGVLGKIQSFSGSSLEVATPSGVVRVTVTQPLVTYKQVPSDLSMSPQTPVGVASVAGGWHRTREAGHIFPKELRGAAEGNFWILEATSRNRIVWLRSKPAVSHSHDERPVQRAPVALS